MNEKWGGLHKMRERLRTERGVGGRIADEDEQAGLRDAALAKFKLKQDLFRLEHSELAQKLEGWLGEIDFDELNEIFAEQLRRSGIDTSRLNPLFRENIYMDGGTNTATMSYTGSINAIQIHANEFEEYVAHQNVSNVDPRLIFMQHLIHEGAHAASANITVMKDRASGFVQLSDSGLNHRHVNAVLQGDDTFTLEENNEFLMFNEGVTELVADEVLSEYLKRRPLSGLSSEIANSTFDNLVGTHSTEGVGYATARQFVTAFVDAIAREVGIPEDVVWSALKRQYFRGDSLAEKETSDLLNESLGEIFTEMLSEADTAGFLRAIRRSYPKITLTKDQAINAWLAHLQLKRGDSSEIIRKGTTCSKK